MKRKIPLLFSITPQKIKKL